MARGKSSTVLILIVAILVIAAAALSPYYTHNSAQTSSQSNSTTAPYRQASGAATSQLTTTVLPLTTEPSQLPRKVNYTTNGIYYAGSSLSSAALQLPTNYTYYVCGAAGAGQGLSGGISDVSWYQSIYSQNYSSVGLSQSHECLVSTRIGSDGAAIVGVGVNSGTYSLYYATNSLYSNFTINQSASLAIVVITGIYNTKTGPTSSQSGLAVDGAVYPAPTLSYLPNGSSCSQINEYNQQKNELRSGVAVLLYCRPLEKGKYTLNLTMLDNASAAVYLFNRVNLSIFNSSLEGPSGTIISIAEKNYLAPYCQGSSQAPVGQSGLPCAEEVGSTYHTFTNVSGAFDCAGFVQYVYGQIGIKIPRNAYAQFFNTYSGDAEVVPVPGGQTNTVPGDLVYFSIPGDNTREPAHVAMCLIDGCNVIIQDGGPLTGWPGTVANLDALLCTNSSSNPERCVMGFDQVVGSPIFISNQTIG